MEKTASIHVDLSSGLFSALEHIQNVMKLKLSLIYERAEISSQETVTKRLVEGGRCLEVSSSPSLEQMERIGEGGRGGTSAKPASGNGFVGVSCMGVVASPSQSSCRYNIRREDE